MNSSRLKKIPKVPLTPLTHENYAFKVLEPIHTEEVIKLLGTEFESQEPLTNAYYRNFPLEHHKRLESWSEFWRIFADDFGNNNLSVGCFDMESGEELVGASVAKDLHYVPEGFNEYFMKGLNFISPCIRLE